MIDISNVIADYNKHMEGADLFDQSVSAYRSKIRVKKWYWPIFLYMFLMVQLVPRQKKIIDKKAVVPIDNLRDDCIDNYPQEYNQKKMSPLP